MKNIKISALIIILLFLSSCQKSNNEFSMFKGLATSKNKNKIQMTNFNDDGYQSEAIIKNNRPPTPEPSLTDAEPEFITTSDNNYNNHSNNQNIGFINKTKEIGLSTKIEEYFLKCIEVSCCCFIKNKKTVKLSTSMNFD